MYSNNTNRIDWKQTITLVILGLFAWQAALASAYAQPSMNDEPDPATSQIVGYVFAGSDQQGRIVNVEVNLLDMEGNVLDTAMTNGSGSYSFNVAGGSYIIENSENGDTRPAAIADNVVMVGLDFYNTDMSVSEGLQLVSTTTSQIVGYVFGGENQAVRLVNTDVALHYLDGTPVLNGSGEPIVATTNESGSYSFNVIGGEYLLRNTLNGETRPVTVADNVVMVGLDFYDVSNTAVPLAVSLTNVQTVSASTMIIALSIMAMAALSTLSVANKR